MSVLNNAKMSENQKFERVYDTDVSRSVWRYDYSITRSGPVSVSIQMKDVSGLKEKKTLGDLVTKKKPRKKL